MTKKVIRLDVYSKTGSSVQMSTGTFHPVCSFSYIRIITCLMTQVENIPLQMLTVRFEPDAAAGILPLLKAAFWLSVFVEAPAEDSTLSALGCLEDDTGSTY